MRFIKALLLEIFRPIVCSVAGISRAIAFKRLEHRAAKPLKTIKADPNE
ncbi:hypothetical protein [Thiomicrorhabdus aquaedulcis]|nr:hypothetical protein [Thiomicrorhabdus aquaedulcis]